MSHESLASSPGAANSTVGGRGRDSRSDNALPHVDLAVSENEASGTDANGSPDVSAAIGNPDASTANTDGGSDANNVDESTIATELTEAELSIAELDALIAAAQARRAALAGGAA